MTFADQRKLDEALGLRDREITKEESIDERKDSDIRADAKAKRENRDGSEAGVLAQGAQGVAEISPELAHNHSFQRCYFIYLPLENDLSPGVHQWRAAREEARS